MKWQINNDVLEYIDETHTYLVNGVIVPSVTQILHKIFPTKYEGIDPEILQKAAKRGTYVHESIQVYEETGFDSETQELHDWKFLKKAYKFECLKNEIPVIIRIGNFICAGRLDLVLRENGLIGLGDIKATSVLDKEYLTWQLNLYRIGYQQCYNEKIEFLRGIHLRKGVRKYVQLPIKEDYIKENICLIQTQTDNQE